MADIIKGILTFEIFTTAVIEYIKTYGFISQWVPTSGSERGVTATGKPFNI